MNLYLLLITIPCLFSIYELSSNKQVDAKVRFLFTAFLIIVSGFRYNAGNDYFNYVFIFNHWDDYTFHVETIFLQLCQIIHQLGFGFHALLLACSALTIIPLAYVLNKRYPQFFFTGFFLYVISYVFFESWNTMRQAIAMTFVVLGVHFYDALKQERKRTRLFSTGVCFFVAFLFHKSFLVLIPFFCWVLYRDSKSTKCITYIMAVLLTFIAGKYILNLYSFAEFLIPDMYSGSKYLSEIEQRGVSTGIYQIYLSLSAIGLALYWNKKKKNIETAFLPKLVDLYILGICVYNIFIGFYIALRFYWYFYIFLMFLLPDLFLYIQKRNRYLIYVPILLFLLLYTITSLQTEYYRNPDLRFDIFVNYYNDSVKMKI